MKINIQISEEVVSQEGSGRGKHTRLYNVSLEFYLVDVTTVYIGTI